MKNENEIQMDFYQKCANLFGLESDYKPFPYRKRTRWNNRSAGNGRYEGRGLIRMFSPTLIIVTLHNPKLTGQFKSGDEALLAIEQALVIANG
jgi:hypothetical protein